MIEEVIDCIMYVFSFFYSYLKMNSNLDFIEKNNYDIIDINKVKYIASLNGKNIVDIIVKDFVWNIRRMFPERKYHKSYKEITDKQKEDRLFLVSHHFITIIEKLLIKLIKESHMTLSELNEKIIS